MKILQVMQFKHMYEGEWYVQQKGLTLLTVEECILPTGSIGYEFTMEGEAEYTIIATFTNEATAQIMMIGTSPDKVRAFSNYINNKSTGETVEEFYIKATYSTAELADQTKAAINSTGLDKVVTWIYTGKAGRKEN